jgi:DNA mismatch endonuclease (patch repair protein)
MDTLTPEKRSWLMSRVRGKDTKPELIVRSLLHRSGLRFSLRRNDLPGRPDIVMPKHNTVVFVHGCFWHRHKSCKLARLPKSNTSFWKNKFETNVARDCRNQRKLRALGWRVIVLWECGIMKDPLAQVARVRRLLGLTDCSNETYPNLPDRRAVLRVAEERLHYNLEHNK